MNEEVETDGIDWEGAGYYGCPEPPADCVLPADPTQNSWLYWKMALKNAKAGNYELVPGLLEIVMASVPSPLAMACGELYGDVASPTCFQRLITELEAAGNFDVVSELSNALSHRGILSDVPVLLRAYERHCENKDADVIPVLISDLIGSADGPVLETAAFDDLASYKQAVTNRCDELADEFGSDQVLVYRGSAFGVRGLARYIKDRVLLPFPDPDMRHRFEAATGIDCSNFFLDGEFQPLVVAAAMEAFLDSPESERYEDGVRYFFGHRLAD